MTTPTKSDPAGPECPDGGRCWHHCSPIGSECFRVAFCGPLSGVFPGGRWPRSVVESLRPSPGGNGDEATYKAEPVQPPDWTPDKLTQVAINKAVAAELRKLAAILEGTPIDWAPSLLAACLRIRAERREHGHTIEGTTMPTLTLQLGDADALRRHLVSLDDVDRLPRIAGLDAHGWPFLAELDTNDETIAVAVDPVPADPLPDPILRPDALQFPVVVLVLVT